MELLPNKTTPLAASIVSITQRKVSRGSFTNDYGVFKSNPDVTENLIQTLHSLVVERNSTWKTDFILAWL